MIAREANTNDLNEILQLYLYLHEESIPDDTEHLRNTWKSIKRWARIQNCSLISFFHLLQGNLIFFKIFLRLIQYGVSTYNIFSNNFVGQEMI